MYVCNIHTHRSNKKGQKTQEKRLHIRSCIYSRTFNTFTVENVQTCLQNFRESIAKVTPSKALRSCQKCTVPLTCVLRSFCRVYALGRATNSQYEHRRICHLAFFARCIHL